MFKNDFSILSPRKVNKTKPIIISEEQKKIDKLKIKYCIFYFDDKLERINSAFNLIESLFGSVNFYSDVDIVRKIVFPLLTKKERMLDDLISHYKKMKKYNPSLSAMKVSFSLNERLKKLARVNDVEMDKLLSEECELLQQALTRFLNRCRHRAIFERVIGYFWVLLREPNGLPYLHVNFYIDNERFNANLGREIQNLWLKVTDGKGGLKLFTISKFYPNSEVINASFKRELRGFTTSAMKKLNGLDFFTEDFNLMDVSSMIKYLANPQVENTFVSYMICLAQESYNLINLNETKHKKIKVRKTIAVAEKLRTGFSLGNDDGNLDMEKTRKISLKSHRSYAVSKIKTK